MLRVPFFKKNNVPCFLVSAHCNYNIEKPFIYLLNLVMGGVHYCQCLSRVAPPTKLFEYECEYDNELGLKMRKIDPPGQHNYLQGNKRIAKILNKNIHLFNFAV
eukprot:TRINITY_DN21200_c0_g1_i2.p1 TRINITY_DN21200_c0_g1~~TRINITY_DN21200_c0_g1_i2.p1  ORF type:complete len:104 (+),score=27.69 TRINITY_DN21200_c0_g1_i2:108-419(+)